jgi:hypothetical protein
MSMIKPWPCRAPILHTKGTFSSFVLDLLYVYEKSLVGLVVRAEKVAEYDCRFSIEIEGIDFLYVLRYK